MKIKDDTKIKVDHTCDYIPFVSTFSNIYDIFIKNVPQKDLSESLVQKPRFWTHIKEKSTNVK